MTIWHSYITLFTMQPYVLLDESAKVGRQIGIAVEQFVHLADHSIALLGLVLGSPYQALPLSVYVSLFDGKGGLHLSDVQLAKLV